MESMDFIYDLTEKMQDQNIDYFLVAVRDNKVDDVIDIFFNVNSDRTYRILKDVFDQSSVEVGDILEGGGYEDSEEFMFAGSPETIHIFDSEENTKELNFEFEILEDEEDEEDKEDKDNESSDSEEKENNDDEEK